MLRWSWLAGGVTLVYLCVAVYVVQDELRHTGGGWINLRGMATSIATLPSQVTVGTLLEAFGIQKVNFAYPRVGDYLLLLVHVFVTAACVYLGALGIESLFRRTT